MAKTLEKRTNILFDQELWNRLSNLSKKENRSVGELVRTAVQRTYFSDDRIVEERRKAFEHILAIRPKPVKGKIDYKEMINYGRER